MVHLYSQQMMDVDHPKLCKLKNCVFLPQRYFMSATWLQVKENCCDLNLGKSLCIFTSFFFPDSGLYLLLLFSVTPFKIDQNRNQNCSIDKVKSIKINHTIACDYQL